MSDRPALCEVYVARVYAMQSQQRLNCIVTMGLSLHLSLSCAESYAVVCVMAVDMVYDDSCQITRIMSVHHALYAASSVL